MSNHSDKLSSSCNRTCKVCLSSWEMPVMIRRTSLSTCSPMFVMLEGTRMKMLARADELLRQSFMTLDRLSSHTIA